MQSFVLLHAIESDIELSQGFWGKEEVAPPMSYIYPNFIIAVFNDIYFAYNCLSKFIHRKSKAIYPENSGKSVTTVPFVEQFSLKFYRHRFIFS